MDSDGAPAPPARLDETDPLGLERVWARLPGAASLVIHHDRASGARVMSEMRWGLRLGGRRQLYLRAETLIGRGPLREAVRRRRIIVPVDGYTQRASRGEGEGQDFAVSRRDGAPMAIAGVWSEEENGPAFCAITCRANAALAPIHDRMPVILGPELWSAWLSDRLLSALEAGELMRPCPPEWLHVRPLRRRRPRPVQGDAGEQLRLLGLDAGSVMPVGTGRQRKAAANRMARSVRRALG